MMKKYTIGIDGDKLYMEPENLSLQEGVELTMIALEIFMETTKKQMTGDDFEIRSRIYDMVVVKFSDVINKFYPEHVELYKKTPEELIKRMEELARETGRKE